MKAVDAQAQPLDPSDIAPPTQAHDTVQATQLNHAIPKPHSARLRELTSTSLPASNKDVRVQSEHLAEPARNSTSLQDSLSNPEFSYQALFERSQHENAALIRERDALKKKLHRASE